MDPASARIGLSSGSALLACVFVRPIVVESERLLLGSFTPSDLDSLYAIQSDPRVGRYTDTPRDRAEAALRFETAEAQRARWAAAPWVARTRTDGSIRSPR